MLVRLSKIAVLIMIAAANLAAQKHSSVTVCRPAAFRAFKRLPQLIYECPEDGNQSDEKILKLPARVAALRSLERKLESLSGAAWWNLGVDDLNACEIHGGVGRLSKQEREKVKEGEYFFQLFGNRQMRLVVVADPCYQTEYSGANAFLLVHKGDKVSVTQVLNGYASRVANSVGVDFATLQARPVIEISTANSFPPSLNYYYFALDPRTNKAVPEKIFKEEEKLTNEIYSAMLMADPKELGLPADARELNIIRNGRLASSFSAYAEEENGKVDNRLRRIIYRWNGRFYENRH